MPVRKIPRDDLFRERWKSDLKATEIAALYGVSSPSIYQVAKAMGLPPRRQAKAVPKLRSTPEGPSPAAAPDPEPIHAGDADQPALVGQLVASNGRYAVLAAIAEQHGMTLTETQRRYHAARAAI